MFGAYAGVALLIVSAFAVLAFVLWRRRGSDDGRSELEATIGSQTPVPHFEDDVKANRWPSTKIGRSLDGVDMEKIRAAGL